MLREGGRRWYGPRRPGAGGAAPPAAASLERRVAPRRPPEQQGALLGAPPAGFRGGGNVRGTRRELRLPAPVSGAVGTAPGNSPLPSPPLLLPQHGLPAPPRGGRAAAFFAARGGRCGGRDGGGSLGSGTGLGGGAGRGLGPEPRCRAWASRREGGSGAPPRPSGGSRLLCGRCLTTAPRSLKGPSPACRLPGRPPASRGLGWAAAPHTWPGEGGLEGVSVLPGLPEECSRGGKGGRCRPGRGERRFPELVTLGEINLISWL